VSPQENASPAGEKETAPTPTPTPQPIPPDPGEPESPEDEVNPLEVKTRYVSPSGNDSPGYYCDTISFPCKTIQWAINKSNPGDTVKVASGTYTFSGTGNPTPNVIIVSKSITLLGGWDVGFVSQNGAAIIDGENVNNGILAQNASATILVEKFIIQNSISYDGGGIYLSGATFTLRNSTIWNNHARRNGAGIFVGDNGNLSLLNSTISDNIADDSGGGIFVGNGTVNILYSTIADNQASSEVAGVDNSGGTVSLKNSILANNDIASAQRDCSGTIGTSDHNVISNTSLCTIVAGTGDQFNFDPKININLDFVLPIYTLLAGSPAIDTGDSTNCPFTDEVGNLRPADGDGNGSALCDIGAYENQDLVNIIEVDGSGQSTVINSAYPSPLKVKVVDNWGVPIGGVLITFSAPESGASGIFTSSNSSIEIVTSDSSGFATSSTFTANGTPGNLIVQATTLGFATHVDFQLNNAFILYVATTGNDINDCLATTTPCATIQAAVDKAANGDRILITAETYTGTNTDIVYITKDISLVGGWDPIFTIRTGMTLLDGETLRRGIRIVTAVVQLERFNIINGFTNDSGGGIYNTGTLTLVESSISNNIANVMGGGIANGGHLIMDRTSVFKNSARWGGGISAGGVTLIQNSTISDNLAITGSGVGGGGIYSSNSNLVLKNTTIFRNRSTNSWGGGIGGEGATVENSIISNNTDTNFTSICDRGDIISNGHNIFGDFAWCPLDPQPSDLIGIDPNIFYLDVIGMAALYQFSPAVDAGNPATCLAVDQRGLTRPVDGNGDGLATCDIGAYEYSGGGTTPTAIFPFQGLTRYAILEQVIDMPLGIFVMDENGQGVAGVNITFTAPAAGASGVFSSNGLNTITIPTNAVGLALAGDFTTNNIAGSFPVQATAVGLGNPVIFYIANGMKISTYTMNHQEDPPGILPGHLICNETQPACTNGDDLDADHAQSYAIDTFKFYLKHHMRNSLDGNGMPIVNSVHYGTNYQNAFWDGSRAVFGDNQPTDDVVGHELTHGVTESTSGLFYYYQSGAINESFSDLWGEFIDQTNGSGNDTSDVKWLLGEDNEIYRSMRAPYIYFQPDRMTSGYYHRGDQEDLFSVDFDNGGVHTNSGVNNKAVYLMADGNSFFKGLGIYKVAAIYYEAQTHLLTSGSDYKDLYYALIQACRNVIGETEGVTLADCGHVEFALNLVEMNKEPLTGFMPEAQLCASNEQANNLFFDDFESANSSWDLSYHTPANVFWNRTLGYAASGLTSLYGIDPDIRSDMAAAMANSVKIPSSGSTYLYFNHAFGFENSLDAYGTFQTWDGGVLEYKVDNGAWQDAGSLWDSGQRYNGSIKNSPGATNPLGGRSAFVRDSHGYVSSRYNLGITALKGHNVKFRWRVGSDANIGNLGWVVDDVRIYTCETIPVQPFLLSVSKSGTGSGTLTSSPAGINCGSTCSYSYNYNTSVTLTAAASTGSTFTGWSGGGCSGTGTCTVTLTEATSVTANFTISTHLLSVSKSGTGSGTLTSSPAGINCGSTCSYSYNYNTSVTLTAAASTGSTFTGWSGACSGTGTCTVTMTAARSVTANFAINTYLLSVSKSGTGSGTVTSSPAGINCGST
jgi:Zn-dependent metalloprotease